MAGLSGWKHAIRGDSSFFAHGYRVILVALTAAMLGVGPQGWIVLVMAGCSIFIAELNHSAVDTLARAIGDPEEPRLKVAREIAAGGVLVAVVGSAIVVGVILALKFGELLGLAGRRDSDPTIRPRRSCNARGPPRRPAGCRAPRPRGQLDPAQVLDVGAVVQLAGVAG